jgi:hypothetical protein
VKQARKSGKSLAPDHPRLTVNYRWANKIRKSRVVYDFFQHRNKIDYNVYESNIDSLERAVKERLFYVSDNAGGFSAPPKPASNNTFRTRLAYVEQFFKTRTQYVSPLTKDEFLRAYDGRRRAVYEKAYESLRKQPVNRKDSWIKFFQKVEKLNFTSKPDSAPRGISPRTPRYHVSLGVYIKKIEHLIYLMIDDLYGSPTIMKGKNMLQRGKVILEHWNSFDDPVAIGLDASRFDQHVSEQALRWEHSIYNFFYLCKHFRRLLEWQTTNKGYGYCKDGSLRFSMRGGRMSGDMNTALGNCLIMSTMLHSFCVHVGIRKFKAVNDGDDCVLFIERRDLCRIKTLSSYFKDFGFTMKQEPPVDSLERIEFCQSRPIRTSPTECVLVRDINVCFAKDSISIKPLNTPKLARRWSRAIGLCGLSLTAGIPIAQEFYSAHIRSAGDVKELKNDPTQDTGMARLAAGMSHRKYVEPSDFARYSFWRAFGIEPARQKALESRLKSRCVDYGKSMLNNMQLLLI